MLSFVTDDVAIFTNALLDSVLEPDASTAAPPTVTPAPASKCKLVPTVSVEEPGETTTPNPCPALCPVMTKMSPA